jgi:RND family efflux transporter MFP subunit
MFKPSLWAALLASSLLCTAVVWAADRSTLATVAVQSRGASNADRMSYDGVVEAVRQSTVSAQVPGVIVGLNVRAGDSVHAGQELVRIDARAANQNASASAAQVEAARANLQVASKELERQKQLFDKQYISQGALERAQAQFQATQAQMQALQAQAESAQTQSRFFVITAPYSGVVSEVNATVGDMAMPGRALLVVYDPAAVRITAAVPAGLQAAAQTPSAIQFEIPDLPSAAGLMTPEAVQLLPAVDAATHTSQIHLLLPHDLKGAIPGLFARVWAPANGKPQLAGSAERLYVPSSTVVRRAEMTGLYVVNEQGRPVLRQVRLGRIQGDSVEVLSGVEKKDKIAADPQAAAKVR